MTFGRPPKPSLGARLLIQTTRASNAFSVWRDTRALRHFNVGDRVWIKTPGLPGFHSRIDGFAWGRTAVVVDDSDDRIWRQVIILGRHVHRPRA